MYQSQQFHTSNYRGNQQGHDAYLRSDSQSPSSYGTQNVTSQYRGLQKTFQPTGTVNSVYGQSGNTSFNQQPSSNFGGSVSAQNYHTANYRGDQQGHDSYLRSDSSQPSQSQFGASNMNPSTFNPSYNTFSNLGNTGVSTYNPNQNLNQNFNQNPGQNLGQSQNQFVSPESFHTANYRGNQQGHDSYLRGDSSQPAQSQYSIGASGTTFGNAGTSSFSGASNFGGSNMGVSSFGTSNYNTSSNFVPSNIGSSSFGTSVSSNQNTNQYVSPESFHTANYKGNQEGHDSYLRADSRQPAQSQFGTGMTSGSFGSFNNNNRF